MKIDWDRELVELDKKTTKIENSSFHRKRPIGTCEDCGAKIYQTDEDELPYRLCYSCNRK